MREFRNNYEEAYVIDTSGVTEKSLFVGKYKHIGIYCHSANQTTFYIQMSVDGANWYDISSKDSVNEYVVIDLLWSFPFIKIKSDDTMDLIIINAKP